MRSAIEIFCSRVVFRLRKNNELGDEYDADAGGLRVCAAVDGRQCHATVEHVFDIVAVISTSQIRWDLSRIQLIGIDLFAFYCV